MLRHPSFKGLREDQDPREVVLERPLKPDAAPPAAALVADSEHPSPAAEPSIVASARPLAGGKAELELEGRTLRLSNLDKVLYPATGFTKGDLIDYYARSPPPVLLPHLHAAHLALPGGGPAAPDDVVFDLDPSAPADIIDCCQVAFWIRAMLGELGLSSYAKTSGSKGLQLYVPLNSEVEYDTTKPFARSVAETLERQLPERVVSRMTKSLRPEKVLVDWSQNDDSKTTVCVYSLRAKERPSVSTPVEWEEVEQALTDRDPALLVFDHLAVLERVEERGDPFAAVPSERQELPRLGG